MLHLTLSRSEVTRRLSTRSRRNSSELSLNSVIKSFWVCEFLHRTTRFGSVVEGLHCRTFSESRAPREYLAMQQMCGR